MSPALPVFALAFSPDARTLAVSHQTTASRFVISFWDLQSLKQIGQFVPSEHRWKANSLAFSPDSQYLAAGTNERVVGDSHTKVKLIDIPNGKVRDELRGHDDGVDSLAFSPDGKRLLVGASAAGETVKLWDLSTGENRAKAIHLVGRDHFVAFSDAARAMVIDIVDEKATLWDVEAGEPCLKLVHRGATISREAFRPDGKSLATGGFGQTVRLWSIPQ